MRSIMSQVWTQGAELVEQNVEGERRRAGTEETACFHITSPEARETFYMDPSENWETRRLFSLPHCPVFGTWLNLGTFPRFPQDSSRSLSKSIF